MKRCSWCNIDNPLYIDYHDNEWGIPKHDDRELFELFILEIFQAGLSWETILKKRKNFKEAFDNFEVKKVANYDEGKIDELLKNSNIIRNKLKIKASINNAQIFIKIEKEYQSFDAYIWQFTNYKSIIGKNETNNALSDEITKDLKSKGMKFIGSTIIYSYLQAIGIIHDHESKCFKHLKNVI